MILSKKKISNLIVLNLLRSIVSLFVFLYYCVLAYLYLQYRKYNIIFIYLKKIIFVLLLSLIFYLFIYFLKKEEMMVIIVIETPQDLDPANYKLKELMRKLEILFQHKV